MYEMIIRMSLVTTLFVASTIVMRICVGDKRLSNKLKFNIGIIYGIGCIMSTHLGINYVHMVLNVRDLGPLIAGLFFDPMSGIIAGLIGGIERYIVGAYFNSGAYTAIACGVSTGLAGFLALILNKIVFDGKQPKPFYSFAIGAVMEVFHMYAVIITHRNDIARAFTVVDACSIPMIFFTAIGLAATSALLLIYDEKWINPFKKRAPEKVSISDIIQQRLFVVMLVFILINLFGASYVQTETAYQNSETTLDNAVEDIGTYYDSEKKALEKISIGKEGEFLVFDEDGLIDYGFHNGERLDKSQVTFFDKQNDGKHFDFDLYENKYIGKLSRLSDGKRLLVMLPENEVFFHRNVQAYETGFAAILIFSIVYLLISFMVEHSVVRKVDRINDSLAKITNGDLDEVVDVKGSEEFAKLSNDINMTVTTLKRYINEAKKKNQQEMELANSIQQSSLPKNFRFTNRNEFELYATMDAAKGVGGDFYDFFFVDLHKIALVIADVSGKGIPGALFMMKAKTAIRGYASTNSSPIDILYKANKSLCEGNDADMFVTVWLAVVDLTTGIAKCVNCGHEYPVVMRKGDDYKIYKDNHALPLATFGEIKVSEYEIKLEPGDRIFVYTDGVPEAINTKCEQFGIDRMISVLNNNKALKFKELLQEVNVEIKDFANGAEQFDDITMLIFEFQRYVEDK